MFTKEKFIKNENIEISLILFELRVRKFWKNNIYGTQTGMFYVDMLIGKKKQDTC